jgi:hypothetical protein
MSPDAFGAGCPYWAVLMLPINLRGQITLFPQNHSFARHQRTNSIEFLQVKQRGNCSLKIENCAHVITNVCIYRLRRQKMRPVFKTSKIDHCLNV